MEMLFKAPLYQSTYYLPTVRRCDVVFHLHTYILPTILAADRQKPFSLQRDRATFPFCSILFLLYILKELIEKGAGMQDHTVVLPWVYLCLCEGSMSSSKVKGDQSGRFNAENRPDNLILLLLSSTYL